MCGGRGKGFSNHSDSETISICASHQEEIGGRGGGEGVRGGLTGVLTAISLILRITPSAEMNGCSLLVASDQETDDSPVAWAATWLATAEHQST